MFRNRKSSQKPPEQFYSDFRDTFPSRLNTGTNGVAASLPNDQQQPNGVNGVNGVLADPVVGQTLTQRPIMDVRTKKEHDPYVEVEMISRDQSQWFTPSIMDPQSITFGSFANQTPSFTNMIPPSCTMAGPTIPQELHTPAMQLNLLTPLAIPQSSATDPHMPLSAVELSSFHHQQQYQHAIDVFGNPHPGYAPSAFMRRDTTADLAAITRSYEDPSMYANIDLTNGTLTNGTLGMLPSHPIEEFQGHSENFRFRVSLRASTAMVKEPDEIPITYLNKGQAYTINIVDTNPLMSGAQPAQYRTFVRISFEEEEQRSKPAACWQLWKEGRGSNEAHQRDGKLLAVEHVDPNQGGANEHRHARVQLESANFDGFSVLWSPNKGGGADCAIAVRFNFLSTDFSHSKGVKGIPVRLCAKTSVISTMPEVSLGDTSEVCYCKVKLFRDHGAERKLSNDVTHVKKLMEKVKQQIAQAEIGSANLDKRKRSGSMSSKGLPKSAKLAKQKRPWGLSSQDGMKSSLEDDLQIKLAGLNEMFSSTKPISFLNLKGDPQDDPDQYPVPLDTNIDENFVAPPASFDSTKSTDGNSTSNNISPSTGNHSPSSSHQSFDLNGLNFSNVADYSTSRHGSLDWSSVSQRGGETHKQITNPVKIQRISASESNQNESEGGWIEAMGVDASYQPPMETPRKPKCCFYVRARPSMGQKGEDYYHAIYLTERTAVGLIQTVARKCRFDPGRISNQALLVRGSGFQVVLDDDVVREMPEGQDLTVEFSEESSCLAGGDDRSGTTSMELDDPKSPTTVSPIVMRFFLS